MIVLFVDGPTFEEVESVIVNCMWMVDDKEDGIRLSIEDEDSICIGAIVKALHGCTQEHPVRVTTFCYVLNKMVEL